MLHGCRFARLILIAAVVATASVGRAKVSKSISTTNSNIITFKSDDGRYSFSVDCSEAPDLADWAENRLKPVVSEWYGRLADDFASPGYRPRPSIRYHLRKVEVATMP